MTYFYNSHTGAWANESPPALAYFQYETQLHLGVGWHAYGSEQALEAAVQANNWPAPVGGLTGLGKSPVPGAVATGTKDLIKDAAPSFSLVASGISGWFFRGLKVLFGGILMIVGISKMLNVDNKITALAGKIPVMA